VPPSLPTILFAEDDAALRDVVNRALSDQGFQVFAVPDAIDALHILALHWIDLLLTDIVMPGLDGVELARRAKRTQPGIKVLFTTGYVRRAIERQAQQQGRVLTKPVRAAEMVGEIDALLAAR
jgi:two-component system, cell cycle response regulator CpdR